MLVISLGLYGCSASDQNTELLLIQADNALDENRRDWIRNQLSINKLKKSNKAHGHYYLAQAWSSGINRDIIKAKNHYLTAMEHTELQTQSAKALVYLLKEINDWGEIKKVLPLVNDALIETEILINQDTNKALQKLQELPLDLKDHRYHTLAAQIYFKDADFINAHKHTQQAKHLGSLKKITYYIDAQSLMQLGKTDAASNSMQIFSQLKSLSETHDTNEKLNHLQQLYRLEPSFNQSHELKVAEISFLVKLNKTTEVTTLLSHINYLNLSIKSRVSLIESLLYAKAYEQTLQILLPIKDQQISTFEQISLCQSFVQTQQIQEALNTCQKGVINNKYSSKLIYWYAMALYLNQQQQKADKQLNLALEYAPWHAAWRIQLAESYLSQGLIEKAKVVLNSALDDTQQSIIHFKRNNGLY